MRCTLCIPQLSIRKLRFTDPTKFCYSPVMLCHFCVLRYSMPKPTLITYDSDGSITGGVDGIGDSKKKKKKAAAAAEPAAVERADMDRAIALEKRLSAVETKCWYCMKSPSFKKHMMISLGEHSYLALPQVCVFLARAWLPLFMHLETNFQPLSLAAGWRVTGGVWPLHYCAARACCVHARLGRGCAR